MSNVLASVPEVTETTETVNLFEVNTCADITKRTSIYSIIDSLLDTPVPAEFVTNMESRLKPIGETDVVIGPAPADYRAVVLLNAYYQDEIRAARINEILGLKSYSISEQSRMVANATITEAVMMRLAEGVLSRAGYLGDDVAGITVKSGWTMTVLPADQTTE